MIKFLKKYGIYLLCSTCFILGLLFLKYRSATLDDDLYLFETSIMTDVLKGFDWVGYYGVGVHGFLFKLPLALTFLITGVSMEVATIWNIIIACGSLFLFYKILNHLFKNYLWSLGGSLLLFTNFQFILHLPTYMREFPALFSFLLFIYLVIKKRDYWIIGFSLLLLLDAKETVFLMVLPGYLTYIFLSTWKGVKVKYILEYIGTYIKILLPSTIFICMMLFTSIIPLNTILFTVIPGITEGGVEYQLEHFTVGAATQNMIQLQNPDTATIYDIVEIESESKILLVVRNLIGYVGKLLYPRSFSFLSIPKIIFFPSLLTLFLMIKSYIKEEKKDLLFFSFIFLSYITFFIIRQSYDRYLFPITPVVITFFLIFLKDIIKQRKKFLIIFIFSSILALTGLLFEADYIFIKMLLNIFAIINILIYLLISRKNKIFFTFTISFLAFLTFGVSIFFYYSNGQYNQYKLWGKNYEIDKVVEYVDKDDNIMINNIGWDLMANVYRGDNKYSAQWRWSLKDWVPRKSKLKMLSEDKTFPYFGENIDQDYEIVKIYDIDKILITKSGLVDHPFPYEDRVESYKSVEWLILEQEVSLKNKTLYIFNVVK